ncbi:MAG: hypothetical protein K2N10_08165 [Muribaculaceae bacterium]|nr:hypothetical protein [Muribaculaceae bacterium]
MLRRLLLILSIILLLAGCSGGEADRVLSRAEGIMEQQPDSALALLETIDGATLSGERRARHALLLSQAYEKNDVYITDDSLISIAVDYYGASDDLHYKMMALYYLTCVHMDRGEFDDALSISFDAEKLADELGDTEFLARIKLIIGMAYMYSYNKEGARDYFEQILPIVKSLDKQDWMSILYDHLADLSLREKNFLQALEYSDSARIYAPDNNDVRGNEMFALIGLDRYAEADSVYCNYLDQNHPSITKKAYKLLVDFHLGRTNHIVDSIGSLLSVASHGDSVALAAVGEEVSFAAGDYYNAWVYTNIIFKETNRVLRKLSAHSLYWIQLENERQNNIQKSNEVRSRTQIAIFSVILSLILLLWGLSYIWLMRNRHKQHIAQVRNDLLLVSSELTQLQNNFNNELANRKTEQLQHESEVNYLNTRIELGQIAAQELFLSKYSWIEELGNILLDSEASKTANRAVRDLKKRLDTVKTKQFIPELIALTNKYRNNLINRVCSECSAISDSERNILALLCANLSPRIISFILDIKPQTIYNAKSIIKRKIQACSPALLQELSDVFQ